MNFHNQGQECHAERSEASLYPARQILPLRKLRAAVHCAQDDNTLQILFVKLHNRALRMSRLFY